MIQSNQLKPVYANMVGGRLPVGSANPLKVVGNHVYAMLGNNRIHTHIQVQGGFAYYFAVESKYLTSHPSFLLPFANALPERPLYQGDGVYLLAATDFAAAMVLEGGSLQLICNEAEVIQDYLLGLDLPIYELEFSTGLAMHSVPELIHGLSDKMGSTVNRVSLAVLALCAVVFVGVHAVNTVKSHMGEPTLNVRAVQNDLNDTLKKLSIQQPLAKQVSRIQEVSSTVVRAGGWIDHYEVKAGGQETFEITLPSWVSQDYLDKLGRQQVVTDLRDIEGLLVVRKQNKEQSR